jgi:hypothetical protein
MTDLLKLILGVLASLSGQRYPPSPRMTAGSRHLNLRFPLHADAGLLAVKIWFSILEKLVARTRSR